MKVSFNASLLCFSTLQYISQGKDRSLMALKHLSARPTKQFQGFSKGRHCKKHNSSYKYFQYLFQTHEKAQTSHSVECLQHIKSHNMLVNNIHVSKQRQGQNH